MCGNMINIFNGYLQRNQDAVKNELQCVCADVVPYSLFCVFFLFKLNKTKIPFVFQ